MTLSQPWSQRWTYAAQAPVVRTVASTPAPVVVSTQAAPVVRTSTLVQPATIATAPASLTYSQPWSQQVTYAAQAPVVRTFAAQPAPVSYTISSSPAISLSQQRQLLYTEQAPQVTYAAQAPVVKTVTATQSPLAISAQVSPLLRSYTINQASPTLTWSQPWSQQHWGQHLTYADQSPLIRTYGSSQIPVTLSSQHQSLPSGLTLIK